MNDKQNAGQVSKEEAVKQDPSKQEQEQPENSGELTEVKNANASGLGSIGRSGEPVDEEGGGKEY